MKEPNSSRDPQFFDDLEFINARLSETSASKQQTEAEAGSNLTELASALDMPGGEARTRLNQELELACLATRATGAAIALVNGAEIVCHTTAGPDAPDVGVRLDPRKGMSGSCIQTRQLQHCLDTQTDPRVDPEACRHLGVRSIVVLPLIDRDELFGIVEFFSSQPNAFDRDDLETLKSLSSRIAASRKHNREAPATVVSKESGPYLVQADQRTPQDNSPSTKSDPGLPSPLLPSIRRDIWTPVLGMLIIGAAVLLGTLIGWRYGWERGALRVRASAERSRAAAPSKNDRTDAAVLENKKLQPSAGSMEECEPSVAAGYPSQQTNGGLTICQAGKVIFRLPPPKVLPVRTSRAPSLSSEAGPVRR